MNPYARIKAGMRVTVNPYPYRNGSPICDDTPGIVLKRRGGMIHFRPDDDTEHLLSSNAASWSSNDLWTYRISLYDIQSVEGVPATDWLAANKTK